VLQLVVTDLIVDAILGRLLPVLGCALLANSLWLWLRRVCVGGVLINGW
jgi:hypothetical protein